MWFEFLPSLQGFGEGPCHRYTKNFSYLNCSLCPNQQISPHLYNFFRKAPQMTTLLISQDALSLILPFFFFLERG